MEYVGARAIHILCVDSDPDIRVILELALSLDEHIKARVETSVDAALLALSASGPFDAVLLEARLLSVSGSNLLDHIVRPDGSPATPVILLTAPPQPFTALTKRGVIGLISKPFDPIHLGEQVRIILADTNVVQ